MLFPPPATGKIDWTRFDMSVKVEVNGHVAVLYSKGSGWQAPQFVQDPYLHIHGLSPSLNYGQQAYEGMKAYRAPNGQIQLFRPDEHAKRFSQSAEFLSMPPVPTPLFKKCIHQAISQNAEFVPPYNSGAALYIRPIIIGLTPGLAPSPPEEFLFCVFVQPLPPYLGTKALNACIVEEYDRAAPKGTGAVKVGGNYAPVMRWSERAKKEGFGLVLHLDSQTRTMIDEFSTAAFIGATERDGKVTVVVGDSSTAIQSVTAKSSMQIAEGLGWKVQKRPVKYSELPEFTEVIAAGTAQGFVPVSSITRKSIDERITYSTAEGNAGPWCSELNRILLGTMQGDVEDKYNWCEVVQDTGLELRAKLA